MLLSSNSWFERFGTFSSDSSLTSNFSLNYYSPLYSFSNSYGKINYDKFKERKPWQGRDLTSLINKP